MLPCQRSCSAYWTGCHKTCSRWKDFQAEQQLQRAAVSAIPQSALRTGDQTAFESSGQAACKVKCTLSVGCNILTQGSIGTQEISSFSLSLQPPNLL